MGLEDLLYRGWNRFVLPRVMDAAMPPRKPRNSIRNSMGYPTELVQTPPDQDAISQGISYPTQIIPQFRDSLQNIPTENIDVPPPPLMDGLMQTENINVPTPPLRNGLMQTENVTVPQPPDIPTFDAPVIQDRDIPIEEGQVSYPEDPDLALMQKVAQPQKPKAQGRLAALPQVEPPMPPTPEIPTEEITVPAVDDIVDGAPVPSAPSVPGDIPDVPNLSPIERYRGLLGRTPRREDYQLSTKDKILTALVGGVIGGRDPIRGIGAARELMDRPYNDAMTQHQQELENAGREVQLDVMSQGPEIQRQKIREKALADAENLRQKYAALQQKAEAARMTYDAKMAAAKTAEEKNVIEREWHQAQIGLQQERNEISRAAVGVQQSLAESRARGTAAYEQSVKQALEIARIRSGGSTGKLPSVMEQTRASNAAVAQVLAQHPEWEDFLKLAPPGGQDTLAAQQGWFGDDEVPPEALKAVEEATAAILRRSYPGYGVK